MSEDIKANLSASQTWIRLLFMLLYGLIYAIADVVLIVVTLIQFGFVALSGKRNRELLTFGAQLSQYLYQILRFLTYNSDHRPFPLAEWPEGEAHEPMAAAPVESAEDGSRGQAQAGTASGEQTGSGKKVTKKAAKKKAKKKTAKKKASKKKTTRKVAKKKATGKPAGASPGGDGGSDA